MLFSVIMHAIAGAAVAIIAIHIGARRFTRRIAELRADRDSWQRLASEAIDYNTRLVLKLDERRRRDEGRWKN